MPIIGIGLTKISAERKPIMPQKVNITNNVSLVSVDKHDLSFGASKQEGIKCNFEFVSNYEPEFAAIKMSGEIILMEDPKKVRIVVDMWKKDKTVPQDIMTQVLGAALSKCSIQSIILSQDLNLPSPVPLPKIDVKQEEGKDKKGKDYIG